MFGITAHAIAAAYTPPTTQERHSQDKCSARFSRGKNSAYSAYAAGTAPPIPRDEPKRQNKKIPKPRNEL